MLVCIGVILLYSVNETKVDKIKSLISINESERDKLIQKSNEFDFNDFLSQIAQIKKMGNLKDLVGMIPGMGKMMKDVEIDNDAFKGIEAMIGSMTPYERRNPSKIDTSRRRRIAKGSGTSIEEVNRLMKQFDETKKMMKMMSSGKMNAMKNIRRR